VAGTEDRRSRPSRAELRAQDRLWRLWQNIRCLRAKVSDLVVYRVRYGARERVAIGIWRARAHADLRAAESVQPSEDDRSRAANDRKRSVRAPRRRQAVGAAPMRVARARLRANDDFDVAQL